MTTAQQSLKNADLATALAQLERDVRREPAVAKHRIFLFQLLSVLGQWDRALTQLNVARDMSPDAVVMAQTYQELLQCEVFRQQVFTGLYFSTTAIPVQTTDLYVLHLHENRIAGDDSIMLLLAIAAKPLANPPVPLEFR